MPEDPRSARAIARNADYARNVDHARNQAVYIEMPDGVRVAAEIWLPNDLAAGEGIPTIISFTRYWRAPAFDPPITETPPGLARLNRAGYAAVVVDNRGSGASFGSRATEFSVCETRDFKPVVDWIASQPWSNGRVATIGVSYAGNTAENATYVPSPALKAAVPRFTDFDLYTSILFPGGLRNDIIVLEWGAGVKRLDNNFVPEGDWGGGGEGSRRLLGVKPVDADIERTLLAEAIAQHANNMDVAATFSAVHFRDEFPMGNSLDDGCESSVSPNQFKAAVETNQIPAFHWGSWMDAGTAAGVLARFASYDAPARYVIGAWTHGAGFDANPFKPEDTPVEPSVDEQYEQIFEFLAPYLVGEDPAPLPAPELVYFTMGENAWKRTTTWPPAGSGQQTWYLGSGGSLQRDAPRASGADQYEVDFEVGSGDKTRWTTQLGGTDVFYGDRAEADRHLLTFTSPPLEDDLEITGHPVVELFLASTHRDGIIITYLESVDPSGKVTMIAEGQLRLIHRKVSNEEPPYPIFGPYHTFRRQDASPMVPGETVRIGFALLPTSVLIPKGHALRLALAGHDQDTFTRIPEVGTPTITVHRGRMYPSAITLPVIEKP